MFIWAWMQCRISRVSPSWSARREETSNLTVVDSLNPPATTITGLFVELCCKGPLTDHIAISTEKFICKMYGVPEVDTCNKASVKLFVSFVHTKLSQQPRMQQRSTSCEHTIKQVSGTKHTCHVLIFCLSMKWDGCTWMASESHGSYLCRRYRNHVGRSPHVAVQMDVLPNAAAIGKCARSASKCVLVRDVLTSVEIFTKTWTTLRTGIKFSQVDWSTWNSRL